MGRSVSRADRETGRVIGRKRSKASAGPSGRSGAGGVSGNSTRVAALAGEAFCGETLRTHPGPPETTEFAIASLIPFENTYAQLPDRFYARLAPTPVRAPRLLRLNDALARELGLDPAALASPQGLAMLAGNEVPGGAEPLAMAYAGFQFGNWVPQLGDGRAILLGELIDRDGVRRDVQLKGSGPTPFSRRGDGRTALGPPVRAVSSSARGLAVGNRHIGGAESAACLAYPRRHPIVEPAEAKIRIEEPPMPRLREVPRSEIYAAAAPIFKAEASRSVGSCVARCASSTTTSTIRSPRSPRPARARDRRT